VIGSDIKMFNANNPNPNSYTGPHKWVGHTAGHPFAVCQICGVRQFSPGPGTPDPAPPRSPSGDWYAPHEPATCTPVKT